MAKLSIMLLKQKIGSWCYFSTYKLAGRTENDGAKSEKLHLTEVRRKIVEQSNVLPKEDLIPVPCNPDALCMAYALKLDNGEETDVFPMTRYINPEDILNF